MSTMTISHRGESRHHEDRGGDIRQTKTASQQPLLPATTRIRSGSSSSISSLPARGSSPPRRRSALSIDKPRIGALAPLRRSATASASHGCTVTMPAHPVSAPAMPQWRLTERGMGVIIFIGLLLALAAMVCIGIRAAEVTSESYLPSSSVQQR